MRQTKLIPAKRVAATALALGLFGGIVPNTTEKAIAQSGPTSVTTKAALNRRLPEVKFENVGLADALDFLRDITGANLTVNWRALGEAGITRETPINVRMYGVPLRKVLQTILSEAGSGSALTYVVDDGVIDVTTQQIADSKLYIRIFPIDDLIVDVPQFTDAPDFNLSSKSGGGSGGGKSGGGSGGGGAGGGGLFGPAGGAAGGTKDAGKSRDERAQELVELIQSTIRPDIWKENGGTATIRHFQGKLIISAPLSVLDLIGD